MTDLTLAIPDELVELVAQRAAELVAEQSSTSEADGYIDAAAAAAFLACPVSRIYSLVSAKRVPFHKDGSRLLFDRAELRQYVEAGGGVRP